MNRKNRARLRLCSRSGESIGEVLVALLISALALMMLATLVASSANLVRKSESTINAYVAAENLLVEQDADKRAGTGSVRFKQEGEDAVKLHDEMESGGISVNYWKNETVGGETVISYHKAG